jgi:hypothetical protein
MRLRHAFALTLIGWYLMVPPLNTYSNNPKSFRGWNTQGSYDTARECEDCCRTMATANATVSGLRQGY